jgi:hypothetical protein
MSFQYANFKKELERKYTERLPKTIISELLTFERGMLENTFPQKRLVVNRVKFNGIHNEKVLSFDQTFGEGINMILADNLKGKSSVFKIIKYALTGDDDIARDIKSWIKNIYVEFYLKTDEGIKKVTSFLNFEKPRTQGAYYNLEIDEIIDKEVDTRKRIFDADNEKTFKALVQDFFFKEFDFYHLNWTQKSPVKDKNELVEAKSTWNTYYESIYLASRNSDKLAFGNQEELIFQMLLGLKHTHAINRLKVKHELTTFELAKLRDAIRYDVEKSSSNIKGVKREFEKVDNEIEKLKSKDLRSIDVSDYFAQRNTITHEVNARNVSLSALEEQRIQITRSLGPVRGGVHDKTAQIKDYKDRIKKAAKTKINLEEYVQFGIFFSNLEITVCPHCNTPVSKHSTNNGGKECVLCHEVGQTPQVDKTVYESKIASLQAEITGYEKQIALLNDSIATDNRKMSQSSIDAKSVEQKMSELEKLNKDDFKKLREIDSILNKAEQEVKVVDRLIDLEKKKAVLEFQLKEFENKTGTDFSEQEKSYVARLELLSEALQGLKEQRNIGNQDILSNFTTLLLEELRDLGITGITDIKLSESFKIFYNQNSNWVSFDDISEGEQLRVKIAFYLSIIQCDIKYNAGRHPRLLIIDSPNKEEGDRRYREGLKNLLHNVSDKYGEHLQIIIGTASRELEGAVDSSKAIIFQEGEFMF